MRHHLWAKVWCHQHRVSAPSPSAAITHQSSKKSDYYLLARLLLRKKRCST